MSKPFVHLHVHTHYSLLDGVAKIDDLLERSKALGMNSIAITDHGVMYGVIELYQKAKDYGIKPIIGCELYLAPNGMENKRPRLDEERYHLVLLARNNEGYQNLMKLATEASLKGHYYKPRIDLQALKKYASGLIGLSACVEGHIASLASNNKYEEAKKQALEYQEIFGKGHYFLELQHLPNLDRQEKVNSALIKISKETGIPLVATADVHYVNKEDNEVQDILICIQTNKKVTDTNRLSLMDNDLHLKSPEEMWKNFAHVPQALENTQKIADMCEVKIEFDNYKLPAFEVPAGQTADTFLRQLCQEGFKKRYPNQEITQEYQERLDYELSVIEKMGFAGYFLIVQDFVNWAKDQGIVVGPGRGSAAGSLLAYLTRITNLDPIKYNLLFERFLNPDRISLPDVDMDFADHRRDDVLEYVRKKYGHDHVAQIITFGTMAARAAIRDVGRALGVEYAYCDQLAKMIPRFSSLDKALQNTPELIKEYNANPNAKKIIDISKRLEGSARHASMHACGVVITPEPVVNFSPLQYMTGKNGQSNSIVTQYSASSKSSYVEKIGLLKMDFLGLKNLTIIENALKVIKKTTGIVIDIDNLSLEDKLTYEIMQRGETTGVFQLESSGMKRYLRQLKPNVFEDIIAMVALYRPGPMEWIPDFINGKYGRKKVDYLHPKLKPILENTYGVAVYQEQVMQIARELAGFTPGEADVLRKAMGKKIHELIQEQKKKFVDGCIKQGVPAELGEKVFSFIEPFAGYGFNRSHAACYALVGYQTAFLKAHYPAQFMAALLNSDKNDLDRVAIEIEEARTMGIEVLPPNVNESFNNFTVIVEKALPENPKKIRFGLEAIKGVGENIAGQIIKERQKNGPFKDIIDLVERVQNKDMNKKSLEALALSGALDEFIERNKMVTNLEKILHHAKEHQKNATAGQTSLFAFGSGDSKIDTPKITLQEAPPASARERLSWEKQFLGLYISDHPLRNYQKYFQGKSTPIRNLSKEHINRQVIIGGIITKLQKIVTRNNQLMYFAVVEDGLGKIETLIFPKIIEKDPEIWKEESVVLLKGRLSDKDEQFKLVVNEAIAVNNDEMEKFKSHAKKFSPQTNNGNGANSAISSSGSFSLEPQTFKKGLLEICLTPDCDRKILDAILQVICNAKRGECRIFLRSADNNGRLETPHYIAFSQNILSKLEELVGKENIKFEE